MDTADTITSVTPSNTSIKSEDSVHSLPPLTESELSSCLRAVISYSEAKQDATSKLHHQCVLQHAIKWLKSQPEYSGEEEMSRMSGNEEAKRDTWSSLERIFDRPRMSGIWGKKEAQMDEYEEGNEVVRSQSGSSMIGMGGEEEGTLSSLQRICGGDGNDEVAVWFEDDFETDGNVKAEMNAVYEGESEEESKDQRPLDTQQEESGAEAWLNALFGGETDRTASGEDGGGGGST